MKSNNKGITLVVLLVTIIVMLILAGVSVNMALNNDTGVVKQANDAKSQANRAEIIEEVRNEFNARVSREYYGRSEEDEQKLIREVIEDKYAERTFDSADKSKVTINGEEFEIREFNVGVDEWE
ncbi:MAG: type II secretion system protein [Candidatus Scatovivens sp.]